MAVLPLRFFLGFLLLVFLDFLLKSRICSLVMPVGQPLSASPPCAHMAMYLRCLSETAGIVIAVLVPAIPAREHKRNTIRY